MATAIADAGTGRARARRPRRRGDRRRRIVGYAVLSPLIGFAVFPLLWMAVSSVKTPDELYAFPPTWIPDGVDWGFYRRVLDGTQFTDFMVNSAIVGIGSTAIVVVMSAMAGFGLARGGFPGRLFVSRSVLVAYVFPTILYAVPLFTVISGIGLAGTYPGIILVHVAFNFPFCTWLMMQYFRSLPKEIEEAGRVDGLTHVGIFVRLAVPLAAPGLATTAIFGFINSWNEFLLSFVILGGGERRTLPVGIYNFVGSEVADWGPLMAATTLAVIPTLVLFLFIQRRITGGLTGGAVKG
ncbi:carbohydrate ABC transporter permease [Phytoactinopolyspora halotolerans]|uniref:Carbohydrate ABC transporter permease n=1 Tax=Phytoactinopolyspora halotolerans TaxID=1981512 RepID=A0A6L9SHB0_9ACTN|nr:carbohydrate ABC transporter permease [Phytoactinopolyspora halotolerans]NEE03480.1 carbohydrate ABC transporter permease [Phytoactinopolyspora halotolerans]